MSRARSPHFESLETRELLSGAHAHAARAHVARKHAAKTEATSLVAATPASISGTLTLNNKAASTGTNSYGYTTAVPVSGQLSGSLGAVSGFWYESTDSQGDYLGPDTITLHSTTGALTFAFNDGTPGPAHKTGPHSVYYQHKLVLQGGTGDFTGETGTGTIDLNMNAAHTQVESVTINVQAK